MTQYCGGGQESIQLPHECCAATSRPSCCRALFTEASIVRSAPVILRRGHSTAPARPALLVEERGPGACPGLVGVALLLNHSPPPPPPPPPPLAPWSLKSQERSCG